MINKQKIITMIKGIMDYESKTQWSRALKHVVRQIESMKEDTPSQPTSKKIGIYAGSFDPFHRGHLNILQKAERLFDNVIVARGKNPNKGDHISPLPKTILNNRECYEYDTLLSEFVFDLCDIYKLEVENFVLIRGLRNSMDLQYEEYQREYIKDHIILDVVYIPCDQEFSHISSSAIRNLVKYEKANYQKYLVR